MIFICICFLNFVALRSLPLQIFFKRMRNLQAHMILLMFVLLIIRPLVGNANFHVVNIYYGFYDDIGFDYQIVIPSTKWGCGGIQTNTIAGGRYPNCYGGYDLQVPNNTCDYNGVTIRPACNGRYFGKLHDQNGGDIGDCYWHDGGEVLAFDCKLNVSNSNYQIIYDRLLCSTKMCGS